MANRYFNATSLTKIAMLFREHRPDQILNTLQFGLHALLGFPKVRLPYDPVWLGFHSTARCNLRCRYCQIWGEGTLRKPPSFQEMNLDMFRELLDRFPRSIAVDFTGGEPLANPHLLSMARLAHERRMKVHLITNGTFLPGKLDAFLATPFEFVSISLNGPDAGTFARLTGASPSLFDDTVNAIAELCRRRRPGGFPRTIRISFVCSKDNWGLVHDVIRLSEKLGVDYVKLRNLHITDMPGLKGQSLYDDEPETQDFLGRLRPQRFGVPVFLPRVYRRDYNPRTCNVPFRMLILDGEGSIARCCVHAPSKRWGNALEDPDIWNGPTMLDIRRELHDKTRPLPGVCLDCEEMVLERRQCGC